MRATHRILACLVVAFCCRAGHADPELSMPADLAYGYGSSLSESMQLQLKLTPEQAFETAEATIRRARSEMDFRQEHGFIKLPNP